MFIFFFFFQYILYPLPIYFYTNFFFIYIYFLNVWFYLTNHGVYITNVYIICQYSICFCVAFSCFTLFLCERHRKFQKIKKTIHVEDIASFITFSEVILCTFKILLFTILSLLDRQHKNDFIT